MTTFERTNLNYQGERVFRGPGGNLYHRDNFHVGEDAELEVYNPQGVHIGTVYPDGRPKGGAVEGRVLPGV